MNESKATDAIDRDRRQLLGTAAMGIAVAGAASLLAALLDSAGAALAQPSNQGDTQMAPKGDAIRPFSINFPEEALVDLRRRINATKWPEQEQVPDASQGVQLATIQKLGRRWATTPCRSSSPRSMDSTFISFTFVPNMTMRCR
jgi:hypothetical protein